MRTLLRTTLTVFIALVFTAGMAVAQNNDAAVNQQGLDNAAQIEQTNTTGGATNEALVEQVSTASSSGNGNTVELLKQYGAGNTFEIFQKGTNNLVTSTGKQGGQSSSTVAPSFDGEIYFSQYGSNNRIFDFDQIGQGNYARVRQGTAEDGIDASGNYVDIEAQHSTAEEGTQVNVIDILQAGSNNKVGETDGKSGAYQKGTSNSMSITQRGDGSLVGRSAIKSISGKSYNFNGAGVAQVGTGNAMTITQAGSDVVRYALQDGISNTLTINQNSGQNVAAAVQNGVGNTATITQQ